ncbi:MAG: hypothetical protein HZY76_06755 [Anaerolineae bacterium]|nr:MAG: hypothetical protein HZY76_06755 [Anaerolineae bacterium]
MSDVAPQLRPRCNLWVEAENSVVLSHWRIELLEAVAETGSIAPRPSACTCPTVWPGAGSRKWSGLGISLVETRGRPVRRRRECDRGGP